MTYELFQQGPEVYIPILLISLIVTVLAYGAFPIIFAKMRKKPITCKKYKCLCYGINFLVMVIFIGISGTSSGVPYLLWTWVFSKYGTKILGTKGVALDSDYLPDDPNRVTECKSCGYRDKNYFNSCPKCGNYAKQYIYINEVPTTPINKIRFCRKCGEELVENSQFCRKCGAEVVREN